MLLQRRAQSLPSLGHLSISLRPVLLGDQDVPGFFPTLRAMPFLVPVQMTPASSWWPQLWMPQPRL